MVHTTLTPEDCNCGIVELFNNISTKLYGRTYDSYDCTKVCVGKEIFDRVEEYYGKASEDFAMIWCCYGPKATLEGYEVEAEDNWASNYSNTI